VAGSGDPVEHDWLKLKLMDEPDPGSWFARILTQGRHGKEPIE
jgi:hypothetical protein